MAELSPEALAKIAEALPDTYAENPDQFATDWQTYQRAQEDNERLRSVNDWYETSYKPWFQVYGGDFEEFQKWKQRPAEPETTTPPPSVTTPGSIDWSREDAAREAYDRLNERVESVQHALDQSTSVINATLQARVDEVNRLLALQEQAYGLLNQEVYDKIEPGWKPSLDIPKLVQHAQQHNIGDLRQAYTSYTAEDRLRDAERRGYERAKAEAARQQQTVTTELTGGAPLRHSPPADIKRGYGNAGMDDIMQRIAELRAKRGAA